MVPDERAEVDASAKVLQPGPRGKSVQCVIKRNKTTSTFQLFLGSGPDFMENGNFLLAARKSRRPTSTDFVISLNANDLSTKSNSYIGKLRSNFLGTKFTIYDSQIRNSSVNSSSGNRSGRRMSSNKVSPSLPAGSFNIGSVAYGVKILGKRGPRRMHCILHTIPASTVESSASGPTRAELSTSSFHVVESARVQHTSGLPRSRSAVVGHTRADLESMTHGLLGKDEHSLVLQNKAPRWHAQLQCWCLNFRGRVSVASVKNFQLVASPEPLQLTAGPNDHDRVLLQFGKIGKDVFTMDYRYPLSAFQAFAICLSSFDTKLACE